MQVQEFVEKISAQVFPEALFMLHQCCSANDVNVWQSSLIKKLTNMQTIDIDIPKQENNNANLKTLPGKDEKEEIKDPQDQIIKESNIKRRIASLLKKLMVAQIEFQAKIKVEVEKIQKEQIILNNSKNLLGQIAPEIQQCMAQKELNYSQTMQSLKLEVKKRLESQKLIETQIQTIVQNEIRILEQPIIQIQKLGKNEAYYEKEPKVEEKTKKNLVAQRDVVRKLISEFQKRLQTVKGALKSVEGNNSRDSWDDRDEYNQNNWNNFNYKSNKIVEKTESQLLKSEIQVLNDEIRKLYDSELNLDMNRIQNEIQDLKDDFEVAVKEIKYQNANQAKQQLLQHRNIIKIKIDELQKEHNNPYSSNAVDAYQDTPIKKGQRYHKGGRIHDKKQMLNSEIQTLHDLFKILVKHETEVLKGELKQSFKKKNQSQ